MTDLERRANYLKSEITRACDIQEKYLARRSKPGITPEQKLAADRVLDRIETIIAKDSRELTAIALRDRGMLPADPHEQRPIKPVRFFSIEVISKEAYATGN